MSQVYNKTSEDFLVERLANMLKNLNKMEELLYEAYKNNIKNDEYCKNYEERKEILNYLKHMEDVLSKPIAVINEKK